MDKTQEFVREHDESGHSSRDDLTRVAALDPIPGAAGGGGRFAHESHMSIAVAAIPGNGGGSHSAIDDQPACASAKKPLRRRASGRSVGEAHKGSAARPISSGSDAGGRHMSTDTRDVRATDNSASDGGGARQYDRETHRRSASAETIRDDQLGGVTPELAVVAGGEVGRVAIDDQPSRADLAPIIAEIREQWRRRQAWHRAEKSLTLQAKALCRRLADEGDKKEADVIYKAALGTGGHPMADVALAAMFPLTEARDGVAKHRKAVEKRLAKLAEQLPAAAWVLAVPGVGMGSLAAIIGETGDLSNYANPAKVWKRLGFAPYQGHAGSTWKRDSWRPRTLTKDEWIANPFSGAKYSVCQQIALALFKKQWVGKAKSETGEGQPNGVYGEVYFARRKRTAETHPDWTPAHANADALRVMMKRLLRDLWVAWQAMAAKGEVQISEALPPSPELDGAA